ncbi:hypothetical protein HMPREF2738_02621 [Clostridiales bacterium KLE1615]|nr:hypothetical protein HMPREF2738_02621 [Clostridiales bacterium KLE1615]
MRSGIRPIVFENSALLCKSTDSAHSFGIFLQKYLKKTKN